MHRLKTSAFKERIRAAIDHAGGAAAVAHALNVTPQAVYLWRGGSRPYDKTLRLFCERLGISREWLEKGRGEMQAAEFSGEQNPSSRIKEDTMDCPLHLPAATDHERMIESATAHMNAAALAAYIAALLGDNKTAAQDRYQIASRLTAILAHKISTERPPIKYN